MWQLDNRTPFAAGQGWTRNLDGAETWIVIVKATFDIGDDGSLRLSDPQPPVSRTPKYRGEPGASSIIYDNDFVLGKTTTDIVVNGTAYAPDNRPARAVEVGFRVGPVTKVIRAVGERSWGGSVASEPTPFRSVAIVYERAFGGVDTAAATDAEGWFWANPVGTAYLRSKSSLAEVRLPNFEYADDPMRAWNDRPRPAGFGVIGSNWQERARFAGTYDQKWERERQPLLPTDFDLRHYQVVPADQQSPQFLVGGEPVALLNLTPAGRLDFTLPRLALELETRFMDGDRREQAPIRLHTVILEPDFPRVSLVFHSALECHSKVYKLDFTRIEWQRPGHEDQSPESLLDL
jgi:hypothetical protein